MSDENTKDPSSLSDSGLRLIAENDFWRFEGLPDIGGLSSKGFGAGYRRLAGGNLSSAGALRPHPGGDAGEYPLDVPGHGDADELQRVPRRLETMPVIEPSTSSARLPSAPRVQDKGRLCRRAAPDEHFRADREVACRVSWRHGRRGKHVTGFSRRPAKRSDPREGSRSGRPYLTCVNAD